VSEFFPPSHTFFSPNPPCPKELMYARPSESQDPDFSFFELFSLSQHVLRSVSPRRLFPSVRTLPAGMARVPSTDGALWCQSQIFLYVHSSFPLQR